MASVAVARFVKQLQYGSVNRIMLVRTGALLNSNTILQGLTIPGIAHSVVMEMG